MGRFFQTAEGKYLDDFIYQPNFEAANKLLQNKQLEYDTAVNTLEALNGLLKVQHEDAPIENENVRRIVEKFEGDITDISNAMGKDLLHVNRYLPAISKVAKELDFERTQGNIAKIENTVRAKANYIERMKDLREKDPETFNRLFMEAQQRWNGNTFANGVWNAQDMIEAPDFNGLLKTIKDELLPNSYKTAQQVKGYVDKNGIEHPDGYLINKTDFVEELTEQRITKYYLDKLLNDPKFRPWMNQQQRLGMGTYFDENGKLISPFSVEEYVDENGNKQKRYTLNSGTSLYPKLEAPWLQAYRKEEHSRGVSEDKTYMGKLEMENELEKVRLAASLAHKNAVALGKLKGEIPTENPSRVVPVNQQQFTTEELQKVTGSYMNTFLKSNGGADLSKLNDEEYKIYSKYNKFFEDVSVKNRDDIIKVLNGGGEKGDMALSIINKKVGDDPLGWDGPFGKAVMKEVKKALVDATNFASTNGSKVSNFDMNKVKSDVSRFQKYYNMADNEEAKLVAKEGLDKKQDEYKTVSILKALGDNGKDLVKEVQEHSGVFRSTFIFDANTPQGKVFNEAIDFAINNNESKLYGPSYTTIDLEGRKKEPNIKVEINGDESNNPIKDIENITGLSLHELTKKGAIKTGLSGDYNNANTRVTFNPKVLEELGVKKIKVKGVASNKELAVEYFSPGMGQDIARRMAPHITDERDREIFENQFSPYGRIRDVFANNAAMIDNKKAGAKSPAFTIDALKNNSRFRLEIADNGKYILYNNIGKDRKENWIVVGHAANLEELSNYVSLTVDQQNRIRYE